MATPPSNGSIVSAALIVGASSFVSRVVGLLRDRTFTSLFGAGDTFDAFLAAFRIPDIIFNLVVIGALSAAFIPLFTEKLYSGNGGKRQAYRFAISVFNIICCAVGLLSVLFIMFAPLIMPLIAPGFEGEKLELTIHLSRIMALQPILLAASFVFSGVLNSHKRFVVYALAPILYNLGIIAGAVFLVPIMGISGIGWGVVLGALLHAGIQFPSVLAVGFRWQAVFISSKEDVLQLWRMMLPRVFGLAAQQANLLIVTIIGSTLLAGSIAAFHLANNAQYIPIGIFGIAFAQAAFPTLSEFAAKKQHKEFRHTLTKSFRYIMFFVIPISALFYLLRAEIIRVLFGDGVFDWDDTGITFETFGFLVMSIFAQATIPLLTRAFYARQNTKIPVVVSCISIALNIMLAFPLANMMGVAGLALAFSIASIVQLAVLLGILHHQLDGFEDRVVLTSMFKIVAATLVAAGVAQVLKTPIGSAVDTHTFVGIATKLFVVFVGGLITYVIVCMALKSEELEIVKKYIPRRFSLTGGTETSRFSGLME